jgi:hypothetical protein
MISRISSEPREPAESTWPLPASISKAEMLSSLNGWREQAEEMIAARPAACLLAAVATGFLFGWWFKHR